MSDKTAVENKATRDHYKRRPQGNSNVSEKILMFWKSKYKWGDSTHIQQATGLSRPTIKSALAGCASDDVIEVITNYYLNLKQDEKN